MTFKDDLTNVITDDRLDDLKQKIYLERDRRTYRIEMQSGIDVVHYWIFGFKLLPPGQKIWDELVKLGFKPTFSWGGEWLGGAHIRVRW